MSTTDFSLFVAGVHIAGRQSHGKGMPLLMLHGSGASKAVFDRQFDSALGEIYQMIALDLPGHGQSGNATDPQQTYTLGGLADVVDGALKALNVENPAVLGWSLGGHVALALAAQRPDLRGLALVGTPPTGRGPLAALRGFHTRWDMLLASKANFSDRDAERYMRLCFGTNGTPQFLEDIKRSDGRLRATFLPSMMRADAVDQRRVVEAGPVPIAMINGADDPIVRRGYIEHLDYADLWEDTCHYLAGAAHAAFWEQPVEFNRTLHRFLKDLALRKPAGQQMPGALRA